MIIQAELKREQSAYEGEACDVDRVIELLELDCLHIRKLKELTLFADTR